MCQLAGGRPHTLTLEFSVLHFHRPTTTAPLLVAMVLAMLTACSDSPVGTPLDPPAALVDGIPCAQHEGVARLISDDVKGLRAELTGDAAGTLQLVYTDLRVSGLVEHREGAFVLNRESGEILFGDGVQGRRVLVGPAASGAYRYGASGALTERLAVPDGTKEPAHGRLRIEGWLDPEPSKSSLRYWLTKCDDIP
jgi:hypothetical protein